MTARLTEADRAVWASYARDIRRHPGAPQPESPPPPTGLAPRPAAPAAPPPRPATAPLGIGDVPAGLDRASWQRLRTGKLVPARTLDLHGMTAQRAFHALSAFLHAAAAEHLRCVEIVTGRGSTEGTGVLRRELPLWLNRPDLRPLVLGAVHPHPANPGAVRLLLRRPR